MLCPFQNMNLRTCKGCTRRAGLLMGLGTIEEKASNLPVSRLRQFLLSKPSNTQFTLATRNFKRKKAFARFKIENWCKDPAYLEKLISDNNGVKYLLVNQDLFGGTVDARGMKTKVSKGTARSFLTMITKKNRSTRLWVDNGTKFAGFFQKLCKDEGL